MAVNIVLSLFLLVFIIVLFVMVVFVIAQCRNMHEHDIAPHGRTAAKALISSSAVVQEVSPEDGRCYLLFQS